MLNQVIVNCLLSSSIYIMISLSFAIIYKVIKFFHFAHAVVFTSSAYFVFLFNQLLGYSLFIAIPLSIICSCILGCLMEIGVYKPLRTNHSSSLVMMIASLGIYIIIQNFISMVFGDETKSIRTWPIVEGINIFGARITHAQIIIIVSSIVLSILLASYIGLTKTGKAMRAVASDAMVSRISGINSDKIILVSFAIGSVFVGIAGILVSLDIDMTPTMGMNALLMGVVAMVIGGVGSIRGIVLGAFFLGFAQNFGVWFISSQWQDAIAFGILLIFLLFKPEGFMGGKIRNAEV